MLNNLIIWQRKGIYLIPSGLTAARLPGPPAWRLSRDFWFTWTEAEYCFSGLFNSLLPVFFHLKVNVLQPCKVLPCILARLSQGVPPPPAAFASPPGSTYSASPRSSYAGLPPPAARPPPPYRAPPPDPVQSRPLPSRPSESALTSPPPAPPKRSAAAANNVPPMLPPVAISSSPPPLPRRHPSDVGSAPPRDRSNSQDPSSSSTRISDSQQPSPTDSGFTEDSKSFSEPLGHGRSKSFGNLTVEREEEVLTQAVSLDQVSQVLLGKS